MSINNEDVKQYLEQIKFDYERGLITKDLYEMNVKMIGASIK